MTKRLLWKTADLSKTITFEFNYSVFHFLVKNLSNTIYLRLIIQSFLYFSPVEWRF